jgi:hypothetical protein
VPDADGAGDFAAADAVAEALGENHGKSVPEAALGLQGVMAFSFALRTEEMAILTPGASPIQRGVLDRR